MYPFPENAFCQLVVSNSGTHKTKIVRSH